MQHFYTYLFPYPQAALEAAKTITVIATPFWCNDGKIYILSKFEQENSDAGVLVETFRGVVDDYQVKLSSMKSITFSP
jgi:hypothetical protein